MTIAKHVEMLRTSCDEAIDNGLPIEVPSAMAPGDMLPQGDIGLLMLDKLPSDWTPIDWPQDGDVQLAPGNTRGSRHTIPRLYRDGVQLYRITDGDPLSDLGLRATECFDLRHPEHADHLAYPPGVYRVRHQQTAERERVLD